MHAGARRVSSPCPLTSISARVCRSPSDRHGLWSHGLGTRLGHIRVKSDEELHKLTRKALCESHEETHCPLGFQSETLRWRGILESPEPSSQGGSVGSNPVGATRIRLRRIRSKKPPLWGLSHGWSSGRGFRCVWMGARRFWFRVQVAASRCRWILSRLWTVQTSRHSLDVASSPLFENRRNLRLALMFPKTVSTVVLRLA